MNGAVNVFLGVLVLVLLTKIVNAIGKGTIAEFSWELYTRFSLSTKIKEIRVLKRKAIDLNTQRSNTSSKDEFAKWAKLDREHLKTKSQIETLNRELASQRLAVQSIIKGLLYFITFVPKLYIRIRYRKVAVFWLPKTGLPYYLLWILSFSSAPMGSVSVSSWLFIADWALSASILVASNGFKLTLGNQMGQANRPGKPSPSNEKVNVSAS
jgi:hypothetical protein